MKDSNWMILIGVLALVTLLVFFRCKRGVSYFSGSPFPGTNTIFDLNEMSWIPSEIKTLLKNRINNELVPTMSTISNNAWSSLSSTQRTEIIDELNKFITDSIAIMNGSSVTVSKKPQSPA